MNTLVRALRATVLTAVVAGSAAVVSAADVDAATQSKVDAHIAEIKAWAADPAIVAAVVAPQPAEHATITQEKWKSLSLLDPLVRSFTKNEAAAVLKAKRTAWVNEAFVSNAKGQKVAFLGKPSNWSHLGNPKHDDPMAGKVWQGTIAVDESTGLQQLQVAVPVLKDGKPVGSLIVGLNLAKL
ncbi:hypothetical protein [Opitutus sp. ER46]|uniref:hypothetical protein n=1 Tax=Opitutus sp. ER46 TaxID=2161864 RepID=UPI000D2F7D01|nr:hypothetical protein [Opitutus sp. ER46]PTX92373.1 hypothetical protein DB354_13625 [Opitutus sp. ER46]